MSAEVRQRAAELIARVDRTLAAPRAQGPAWQVPPKDPPAVQRAPARPPAAAESARPATAAGVSREFFDRRFARFEEAIGRVFGAGQLAWQRRALEAERRLAQIESRLDRLEGKGNG
jgi:hypothetical protein